MNTLVAPHLEQPTPAARRYAAVAVLAVAMLIGSITTWLLWRQDLAMLAENGVVESAQAMLLLVAALVYGWRALGSTAVHRMVRTGLALVCLSLMLREADINRFGEAAAWGWVELMLRMGLGAAWVVFVYRLAPWGDLLWRHRRALLLSPAVVLMVGAGVLYAFSWPFDKMLFPLDVGVAVLIEETIQLDATILAAFAAATCGLRPLSAES